MPRFWLTCRLALPGGVLVVAAEPVERVAGVTRLVSPLRCPVRWKNASPYPAALIGSRAAASTDSAVTPGRTAAQAASWAL